MKLRTKLLKIKIIAACVFAAVVAAGFSKAFLPALGMLFLLMSIVMFHFDLAVRFYEQEAARLGHETESSKS